MMNCKNIMKGTCSLTFNRDGYDPLIDYLKGLCILFVVIQHSIPTALHHYTMFALWGRLAVPIFLLIQVFHAYKKLIGGGVKLLYKSKGYGKELLNLLLSYR